MAERKDPSVAEVKALLDNGDVSDEAKRNLLLIYRNRDLDPDGELDQYMDKYDDSTWRSLGEGFTAYDLEAHLTDSYDEAKKQADAAGAKDREHDEAIKGGQATIDGTQRAADNGEKGGAGADSSDELLDAGNAGLRFFRDLLPVYHRIGAIKDGKAGVGQVKQAEDRFHEQRGIQFAKFARGTEDLNTAEEGMRKAHEEMSTRLGQLWGGWSGAASDSSQQFFAGKFTPTVNERVIEKVSTAAQSTTAAMKGLGDLCREKSRYVLELEKRREKVTCGKSTKDWDTTIDLANGDQDDEVLRKVAAIWGIEIGECNWGDVDDRTKQEAITKAQEMTDSFAEAIEAEWENFDKKCTDTKTAVDDTWKKLNEELGKAEENPFSNPGPAKDEAGQQGPGQQGPGGGPSGSGPSGGSPGGSPGGAAGGSPGGAAGGSPGGSPGGAAAMPETPAMPEVPKMPETPEMPGMPQPGTGGPGAPEVETVGEGQDAVQVQEPDQQGTSQVTIIGEDGEPKTYDVRFGPEGGAPGVGTNPTPGAVPVQPGMPGVGTNPTPGVMPGQQGGEGAPLGPGGATPAAPGGQAPQPGIPVVPGEDGKAVIHEGDRTITLERAPDGSIKVDVDNGGGAPPIQETVEFGADDQPGADARTAAPGAVPVAPPAMPGADPIGQDAAGAPIGHDPGASFDPSAPVGTPPQVGGFDAPPASGGTEPVAPAASAMSAGPEFAAARDFDGPAPTTSQSAGLASTFPSEGVSGSFASMSGQLFAGDLGAEPPAQHPSPFGGPPPQAGATGLASADDAASGSPQGATGMGTMADPGAAQGGVQQQSGGGAMSGGMMGGMGGGQQGGGGGEQERTNSSPWRTQGQLFDDVVDDSGSRHRAVLGEDRQA